MVLLFVFDVTCVPYVVLKYWCIILRGAAWICFTALRVAWKEIFLKKLCALQFRAVSS